MSKNPSYYNDFKKNDEGEPEEIVSIKKIVGAMFIALFGATVASASPQQQQQMNQITHRVEWRQHAFEKPVIGGKDKVELENYVKQLEKALEASVEGRKQDKRNARRDEMFAYTAGAVSQS